MDIGHIGAGLALKKVDNKINLGGLIFASELLDIVFVLFVLLGIETIPASQGWQYLFSTLPYSHSFLASIFWTTLTFIFVFAVWRRHGWHIALAIAAAVFSHFFARSHLLRTQCSRSPHHGNRVFDCNSGHVAISQYYKEEAFL